MSFFSFFNCCSKDNPNNDSSIDHPLASKPKPYRQLKGDALEVKMRDDTGNVSRSHSNSNFNIVGTCSRSSRFTDEPAFLSKH